MFHIRFERMHNWTNIHQWSLCQTTSLMPLIPKAYMSESLRTKHGATLSIVIRSTSTLLHGHPQWRTQIRSRKHNANHDEWKQYLMHVTRTCMMHDTSSLVNKPNNRLRINASTCGLNPCISRETEVYKHTANDYSRDHNVAFNRSIAICSFSSAKVKNYSMLSRLSGKAHRVPLLRPDYIHQWCDGVLLLQFPTPSR